MEIEHYLSNLKNALFNQNNWKEISLTRQWASQFPSQAGVYALKEKDEIIYVGETGNIRGRMYDLLDSRNHSIRRTIGKVLFSDKVGFVQATTKQKFPDQFERMVNDHISNNLKIAFLVVELGRKELEELIERDIKIEIKLNKRGKRKVR